MNLKNKNFEAVQQSLATFVKLMRCSETVRQSSHMHLQQHGITESQLAVLEVLLHKGELCQKEIGQKILKSKSNLTTVMANMEKSALIIRKASESDKRYYTVSLTPKGRELIQNVFPEHQKEIHRVMSNLTEQEQMELSRLCKKLGTNR